MRISGPFAAQADLRAIRGTPDHEKTLIHVRSLVERTGENIVVYAERSRGGEVVLGFMTERTWESGPFRESGSYAALDTIRLP